MSQSRLGSMIEAVANVAVGCGVAMATQVVVYPWFGREFSDVGVVTGSSVSQVTRVLPGVAYVRIR